MGWILLLLCVLAAGIVYYVFRLVRLVSCEQSRVGLVRSDMENITVLKLGIRQYDVHDIKLGTVLVIVRKLIVKCYVLRTSTSKTNCVFGVLYGCKLLIEYIYYYIRIHSYDNLFMIQFKDSSVIS